MQLNKFIVYFNIFKIVGLGTFCLPLIYAWIRVCVAAPPSAGLVGSHGGPTP